MKIEVFADAGAVARQAAAIVAVEARSAVAARGRFILAVSGGQTPWLMLRALAEEQVEWNKVHLVQVDERVAPAGHSDRNLTHITESLLSHAPIPAEQIYAMPVEAIDLDSAARSYAQTVARIAGSPPVLDLVHLGLNPDGHTASLIPGDPVLTVTDVDVAMTGEYQGRRRMTLTYPIINRSRRIFWMVTGDGKAERCDNCVDADLIDSSGKSQSGPGPRARRHRPAAAARNWEQFETVSTSEEPGETFFSWSGDSFLLGGDIFFFATADHAEDRRVRSSSLCFCLSVIRMREFFRG